MSLAHWRTQRARAKQKQKAIQMLTLSGVLRPSHIELRYGVPLLKVRTMSQSHRATTPAVMQPPRQPQSAPANPSRGAQQLTEWLRSATVLAFRRSAPIRAGAVES